MAKPHSPRIQDPNLIQATLSNWFQQELGSGKKMIVAHYRVLDVELSLIAGSSQDCLLWMVDKYKKETPGASYYRYDEGLILCLDNTKFQLGDWHAKAGRG